MRAQLRLVGIKTLQSIVESAPRLQEVVLEHLVRSAERSLNKETNIRLTCPRLKLLDLRKLEETGHIEVKTRRESRETIVLKGKAGTHVKVTHSG